MGKPSAPNPTKPRLRSPLVMTHREAFGSWSTDALQLCLQDKKSRSSDLRDDRDEIDQDLQLKV